MELVFNNKHHRNTSLFKLKTYYRAWCYYKIANLAIKTTNNAYNKIKTRNPLNWCGREEVMKFESSLFNNDILQIRTESIQDQK